MTTIGLDQYYFNPEPEKIAGTIVPPITESHQFETGPPYPTVVERFFTKHYHCRSDEAIDEAHTILYHSNRICLIGLADTHVAVKKGIQSISFDIGGCDRSKNQVIGKSKRGGMLLQANSCIAKVICNDGTEYKVVSSINGKLVEVNDRLLTDPTLIGKDGDGYIAVILPKLEKIADIIGNLLTESQYKEKLQKNVEQS